MDKNRMSVIWNVTRACCWNCKFFVLMQYIQVRKF